MSTTNLYDKLYRGSKYNPKEDYKLTIVMDWLEQHNPKTVIDMGCGRGHYIQEIDFNITGVEPSEFLCDKYGWVNSDMLTYEGKADALYCMDVLEHISMKDIDRNLESLSKMAPIALLGIANHSDIQEGVELHLIQEDSKWWEEKLQQHYGSVTKTYEPLRYMVFECSR